MDVEKVDAAVAHAEHMSSLLRMSEGDITEEYTAAYLCWWMAVGSFNSLEAASYDKQIRKGWLRA